jgi:uncharacterized membrane protein
MEQQQFQQPLPPPMPVTQQSIYAEQMKLQQIQAEVEQLQNEGVFRRELLVNLNRLNENIETLLRRLFPIR